MTRSRVHGHGVWGRRPGVSFALVQVRWRRLPSRVSTPGWSDLRSGITSPHSRRFQPQPKSACPGTFARLESGRESRRAVVPNWKLDRKSVSGATGEIAPPHPAHPDKTVAIRGPSSEHVGCHHAIPRSSSVITSTRRASTKADRSTRRSRSTELAAFDPPPPR